MSTEVRYGVVAASWAGGAVVGGVAWWLLKARIISTCSYWLTPRQGLLLAESAGEAEALALRAELAGVRSEINALLASRAEEGDAPASSEALIISTDPDEIALWDRLEFLQGCSQSVAALAALLDECLCDAFSGPRLSARLSEAVRTLLTSAAAAARERVAAVTKLPDARPGGLPALLADAPLWRSAGDAVVEAWLITLRRGGASALCSADGIAAIKRDARANLVALAAQHMTLSLWPDAADANIQWVIGGGGPGDDAPTPVASAFALDNEAHQLFSLDGNPLPSGARVIAVGPTLQGREPVGVASGGDAKGGDVAAVGTAPPAPASAEQLKELRGRRCRTLVIAE